LNLPTFQFDIKNKEGKLYIFDIVRKKLVLLTPEEWVRQHFIKYLVYELNYSKSLIKVESGLKYNQRLKRSDILVCTNQGTPEILIECKSTAMPIKQNMFDQVSIYNKSIQAPYLVITNGLEHYCCFIDFQHNQITYLDNIPVKK
jgi:hypothetical protein